MNASSNTLPQESSRRSDGIIRSLRNTHSVLGAVPPARRNVNDGEVSTIDHSIADQNWLQRLEELKKYKEEYGKVTGVKGSLSTWVSRQKLILQGDNNDAEFSKKRELLQGIGVDLDKRYSRKRRHKENDPVVLNRLKEFKVKYGHTNVPQKYPVDRVLARFVANRRRSYRSLVRQKKSLDLEWIQQLNQIQFEWFCRSRKRVLVLPDYVRTHYPSNLSNEYNFIQSKHKTPHILDVAGNGHCLWHTLGLILFMIRKKTRGNVFEFREEELLKASIFVPAMKKKLWPLFSERLQEHFDEYMKSPADYMLDYTNSVLDLFGILESWAEDFEDKAKLRKRVKNMRKKFVYYGSDADDRFEEDASDTEMEDRMFDGSQFLVLCTFAAAVGTPIVLHYLFRTKTPTLHYVFAPSGNVTLSEGWNRSFEEYPYQVIYYDTIEKKQEEKDSQNNQHGLFHFTLAWHTEDILKVSEKPDESEIRTKKRKSFVAFRSSDLLSGPAIFSTTKDAGFYIEESDITPAVYKEFESFEEAVSYISSYLNKDRE